jgi:hypothetical protein
MHLNDELVTACASGTYKQVCGLLRAGADPCYQDDAPLIAACGRSPTSSSNKHIVALLLDRGADLHARGGAEPAARAIRAANTRALTVLLSRGYHMDSALGLAIRDGNLHMVRWLVEKGRYQGWHRITQTQLDMAVALERGHTAVCMYLLEQRHGGLPSNNYNSHGNKDGNQLLLAYEAFGDNDDTMRLVGAALHTQDRAVIAGVLKLLPMPMQAPTSSDFWQALAAEVMRHDDEVAIYALHCLLGQAEDSVQANETVRVMLTEAIAAKRFGFLKGAIDVHLVSKVDCSMLFGVLIDKGLIGNVRSQAEVTSLCCEVMSLARSMKRPKDELFLLAGHLPTLLQVLPSDQLTALLGAHNGTYVGIIASSVFHTRVWDDVKCNISVDNLVIFLRAALGCFMASDINGLPSTHEALDTVCARCSDPETAKQLVMLAMAPLSDDDAALTNMFDRVFARSQKHQHLLEVMARCYSARLFNDANFCNAKMVRWIMDAIRNEWWGIVELMLAATKEPGELCNRAASRLCKPLGNSEDGMRHMDRLVECGVGHHDFRPQSVLVSLVIDLHMGFCIFARPELFRRLVAHGADIVPVLPHLVHGGHTSGKCENLLALVAGSLPWNTSILARVRTLVTANDPMVPSFYIRELRMLLQHGLVQLCHVHLTGLVKEVETGLAAYPGKRTGTAWRCRLAMLEVLRHGLAVRKWMIRALGDASGCPTEIVVLILEKAAWCPIVRLEVPS